VLAARGARVLLGCREQTRAQDAIARIKRITPNADLVWLPLDLGDLDSVRTAAEIAAKEPRIDVLINNAGIMNPPLTRTKQGSRRFPHSADTATLPESWPLGRRQCVTWVRFRFIARRGKTMRPARSRVSSA